MGMFDALPDIKPRPQDNGGAGSMFDALPDIAPARVSPAWPPDMSSDIPDTPAAKRLGKELRDTADRELLRMAGPVAQSPAYAAASEFINTLGMNAPRNIGAGVRALKTGNSFEREYNNLKALDEAAARQSPWARYAGMGAGALAQGALMAPEVAASMAGRVAQSAGIGAGVGYASEALDSKDPSKAAGAAIFGGLAGGAAAPVAEGLAALGRTAGEPVVNMARGLINPDAEAARRIGAALRADYEAGGPLLSKDQFSQAAGRGQEMVLADFGGDVTRALARSSANTSPEARTALNDVIERRFSTQGDRTADFVRNFGSGQSAVTTGDQLAAAARAANKPAYARAYNDPNAQAIWNEDLAGLMQAQAVQDAVRATMKTASNKAAAQGFKPPKNPFVEDANGNITLRTNPDGSTAIPSIQFWDYVQRNLNDAIGKAQRSGEKSAASDLTSLRGQLNSILDQTVPAFKDARAGAARFFGAEDALEAGQKFVSSTLDNAQAAKAMSKMSKAERDLFAEGFISEMVNKVRNVSDRQTVINKIYNTPNAKQRVAMALGPKRTKELEAFLHVETVADRLRNEVRGNSTTARQLMEMGLAGGGAGAMLGAGAGYAGGGDPQSLSAGALAGAFMQRGFRAGVGKIDASTARRVGEMLASGDPKDFERVVKMATTSNTLLNAFRNFSVKSVGGLAGAISEDRR